MNEKMRRKDRETTEERAYEILKNGEYGILSTIGEDGYPYQLCKGRGFYLFPLRSEFGFETEKC